MRIHKENTEAFIRAIAATITKDPASMEDWRCWYVHPADGQQADLAHINKFKEQHKDADCDLVICPDNDLLLISRDLSEIVMNKFSAELMPGKIEVTAYDLFRDWRRIRVVLSSKADISKPIALKPRELGKFGDVDSLRDVFAEAKNLRKVRQPQHIMVVEDDPLTRRVVANAFKDNYAIISAENAQEAMVNYLLHAPDIVFLDIGLPDASGFAVLHQIMTSDPEAYVIMFSGNSYLDNVTTAMTSGASGFIAKPFKKEKMRHYIQDSAMHHHKTSAY